MRPLGLVNLPPSLEGRIARVRHLLSQRNNDRKIWMDGVGIPLFLQVYNAHL